MSYACKLLMHLNQGPVGSTLVQELVDYPGVVVTSIWKKKEKTTERIIAYNGNEYQKISDAIAAWRANGPRSTHEGPIKDESD